MTALVVQTIALSNSGGITVGAASTTPLSMPTPATLGPGTVNTRVLGDDRCGRRRRELRLVGDRAPGRPRR